MEKGFRATFTVPELDGPKRGEPAKGNALDIAQLLDLSGNGMRSWPLIRYLVAGISFLYN